MATEPTIMKMRLAEINRFVQGLQKHHDQYTQEAWERGYEHAEVTISKKLRDIMGNLPRGYVRSEPSLKTKAKKRYLLWRENQAMADWKKLPEEEQAVWEGYVADGLEFGEVRQRELDRLAALKVGDRVMLREDIWYLGDLFPAGEAGEIILVSYDEVRNESGYGIRFDSDRLDKLNTYAHEIKREAK